MEKIDVRKQLKHLYLPSGRDPVAVDVPVMNFLMIDGEGDPNTARAYADAVEALFSVSYAVKFSIKKSGEADYGVMPLEGLWWADDMSKFTTGDKSGWKWTMMILQPDFVPRDVIDRAIADVRKKKNPAALELLRFESYDEGKCVQILHTGPFSAEGPTIARVHAFIEAHGKLRGKHHEIYLTDIRKADPSRWKTVIRQPMA